MTPTDVCATHPSARIPLWLRQTLACKFVVGPGSNVKKEMGPVSMSFEIPMYNVSQLQVQHLKIIERNRAYNPHRWVRCLTHTESYVCRI